MSHAIETTTVVQDVELHKDFERSTKLASFSLESH